MKNKADLSFLQTLVFPGEHIHAARQVEIRYPSQPLSPEDWLCKLCRVNEISMLGENGAALAALALPEDQDEPELRLFEALFGRDSLRVASLVIDQFPQLARATLLELASYQGQQSCARSEEEPGKIIHEYRLPDDPIGKKLAKDGWQFPYYGASDSTPLFLTVLSDYIKHCSSEILDASVQLNEGGQRIMGDASYQAARWIEGNLNDSPNGLIYYKPRNRKAIVNQTWKDSSDSYFHSDGCIANSFAGIASVEVQFLACDALYGLAELIGPSPEASRWKLLAEQLIETIMQRLWVSDRRGSFFALGWEYAGNGGGRALEVRSSNMGHALDSIVAEARPEIVSPLVEALIAPDMLAWAGVRTVSSEASRYNPRSYHNGSVWPWDTAVIARGLRKVGRLDEASVLEQKLLKIHSVTGLFPELVVGDGGAELDRGSVINSWIIEVGGTAEDKRLSRQVPGLPTQLTFKIAQPPQLIQAWSVAAVLYAQKRGEG